MEHKDIFPAGTLVWHSTIGLGMVRVFKPRMYYYDVHYFSINEIYDHSPQTVKNMVEAYRKVVAGE